jgi:magnesium transporter|tara:strand:- start:95562 stop:96914 length:1353 start_codon:yes stop_codon:yes gene_type:complete
MSFDLQKIDIEQLEENILQGHTELYEDVIQELHPADVAEIVDEISIESAKKLLSEIGGERAADILIELDEDLRAELISDYSGKEIARDLVDNLDTDDAADIIHELDEDLQREVLENIEDPEHARDIADLLVYPENTAGALMGTELIKVNKKWKVMQCVREMRLQAEEVEKVHAIYVVDDDEKLLGTLSLKKLLTTSLKNPIEEVFQEKVQSVNVTTEAEEVANKMQKYDLVVVPVVDPLGRLVGRITIDDIVDVIRDEAKEDYNLASGLTDEVESDDGIITITRARLPWLLIGLFGGIMAASVIEQFDGALASVPKMLFFIPLIAAMGGNVGVQSSAIVVQALASKSFMGNISDRLFKEIGVALLNGAICGLLIIGASLFLGYGIDLALTVGFSLLAVILVAALVGTFVPIVLDKYKIDPAIATGPFITTTNDILGLFVYFSIGRMILGF